MCAVLAFDIANGTNQCVLSVYWIDVWLDLRNPIGSVSAVKIFQPFIGFIFFCS